MWLQRNIPELITPMRLFLRLKKLGNTKTILHIGAHPDDEEIGLLAYVSYKHYGRAVYWSATRGESGQNRINSYTGDAIGVYRTWESLLAREEDGGECMFGPFIDFGFSKTADESFAKWGKENLVRELVRAIRVIEPQIIISRWAGAGDDGHGQHQAVGQAVYDAVEAACSHAHFPEFIAQGLFPWSTGKIYLSTNKTIYPAGKANPDLETDGFLRINTGEYQPLLGRTYQEQAWEAYGRHQTQGMTVLPMPGDFYYYFKRIKNHMPAIEFETDLFQGLDAGLTGMFSGIGSIPEDVRDTLKAVEGLVDDAVAAYTPDHALPSSAPLFEGVKRLKDMHGHVGEKRIPDLKKRAILSGLERKIAEFETVIAMCLGLRLESLCTRARVTPGESIWMINRLWNFTKTPIKNIDFNVRAPDTWKTEPMGGPTADGHPSESMTMYEVFTDNDAELSCPYWLRNPKNGHLYQYPEEEPYRQPLSPPPLSVECTVTIEKHKIRLACPTQHKKAFPGGHRSLPLSIVPPISLHPDFDRKIFLVSPSARQFSMQVTARCNDEERPADGRLELIKPEKWTASPPSVDISLPQVNGAASISFTIIIPPDTAEGRYRLKYKIRCRNRDYDVVLNPVRMGAPGLPEPGDPATCIREEFILAPAQVDIFLINARLKEGRRFGYIEGTGEGTLQVLQSVGVNIRALVDADIAHGDLREYDAIVVGPNAYLLRAALSENSHRLLQYVENGGTLLVQYHTYEYQGRGFAPYAFSYNDPHDRVTDESAPVSMIAPDHPFLRFPNTITPTDFKDWIHDRGLYFFGQWDDRYTTLLSCADAGESQKAGGLVTCRYGRGIYIYIGYSLFRQLSAGAPGAFRLFFNLLSAKPESGSFL